MVDLSIVMDSLPEGKPRVVSCCAFFLNARFHPFSQRKPVMAGDHPAEELRRCHGPETWEEQAIGGL